MGGPFCVMETDDDNFGVAKTNPVPYEFGTGPRCASTTWPTSGPPTGSSPAPVLQNLLGSRAAPGHRRPATPSRAGWPTSPSAGPTDAAVVVGWQGGASTTWTVAVRQGVRKAMAQFKMSKLRLVGQDYRKLIRLDAAQMDYVPWYLDVDTYWREGLNFDIGLAPLRPHLFNRSSGIDPPDRVRDPGHPCRRQRLRSVQRLRPGRGDRLPLQDPQGLDRSGHLIQDPDLRRSMGIAAQAQARGRTIETTGARSRRRIHPNDREHGGGSRERIDRLVISEWTVRTDTLGGPEVWDA